MSDDPVGDQLDEMFQEDTYEVRRLAEHGFPYYAVSNTGDVWNLRSGKLLRGSISPNGYPVVRLDVRTCQVHRLVAKAFVPNPNPEEFNVVDHMDCVPANPNADNLRWTNTRGNLDHQVQVGSLPPRIPDEIVHQICQDLANGVGCTEISRKYGVSHDAVFQIKRGENWKEIASQYDVIPPKTYNQRLTEAQVIEICDILNRGILSDKQIAERYGTSDDAIAKIRLGVNWARVTRGRLQPPRK